MVDFGSLTVTKQMFVQLDFCQNLTGGPKGRCACHVLLLAPYMKALENYVYSYHEVKYSSRSSVVVYQ